MEEISVGEGGLPEELSPFPQVEGGEGDGPFCREYGKQKLRPIRSNGQSYPFEELGGFESVDELMKFKSQVDAHFMSNLNNHFTTCISNQFDADHLSSCSLDSDSGDKVLVKKTRKRKRKTKEMESYVQELMRQVMEKQEQMQQQVMEVIQNKEKERVIRQEEWRHQQMMRLNNDHHIRSQQAARSLALISFIRNTLS